MIRRLYFIEVKSLHAKIGLATLCVFLFAAASLSYAYWRSQREIQRMYVVSEQDLALTVLPSPRLEERGRRVTTVIAQCQFCHGANFAGRELANDRWIGQLHATNLTSGVGGIGADYTNTDWVRAIRHGIRRDGRSLVLMPSPYLSKISDRDLAAVIAYLRGRAPVSSERPPIRVGWLTRFALSVGAAPDLMSAAALGSSHTERRAIVAEVSHEYGAYLVDLGNCRVCHRPDLRGGLHPLSLPGEPPPPDLRPQGSMMDWSRDDFARAMRNGITPDGRQLDREYMPWPAFAGLTDLEIDAIWLYLKGSEASTTRLGGGAARSFPALTRP